MNRHNVWQAPPANTLGQAVPDGPTTKPTRTERRQAQPDLRRVSLLLALMVASITSAGVRHIVYDTKNTTIQMEVTPADGPSPAFQHRLTYGVQERVPGNRPQWYTRSYLDNRFAWSTWNRFDDDSYYSSGIPVDEMDWGKLDPDVKRAASEILEPYVVPGAMRRNCDWGIESEELAGADLFDLFLPEMQSSRSLARLLMLQIRLAIHERRYDDAVKYLRTEYQLGADTGQEPLIICGLVGVAIADIANAGVADLIAAPDSPNLYWALSELPNTVVPLGNAVRNELETGNKLYPFLSAHEDDDMTPEEWNTNWKRHARMPKGFEAELDAALPVVSGLLGYTHAKRRLVDWGFPSDAVEAMPVGQVLSLYSARVYQLARDLQWKVFLAPYSQRAPLQQAAQEFERQNRPLSDGPNRELLPITTKWLPAVQVAHSAEMRVTRNLAALRVIEALRMHAARERGRWPDALDDVTCVPVPLNPATDKPFLYHRDGETAVLELPDSEGFPGYSRRYEITIAKP